MSNPDDETGICSACELRKPLSEFGRRGGWRCKACVREKRPDSPNGSMLAVADAIERGLRAAGFGKEVDRELERFELEHLPLWERTRGLARLLLSLRRRGQRRSMPPGGWGPEFPLLGL
jgi:hypothetical protein